MSLVLYLIVGVIVSITAIVGISYYDSGNNDAEEYGFMGMLGVMVLILWPILGPAILFAAISRYVAENMGN